MCSYETANCIKSRGSDVLTYTTSTRECVCVCVCVTKDDGTDEVTKIIGFLTGVRTLYKCTGVQTQRKEWGGGRSV